MAEMNDRIRELFKQAYGYSPSPIGEPEAKKFAELIVRVYVGVCDDLRDSTDYEFEKDMADNCAQAIMKHFGVDK